MKIRALMIGVMIFFPSGGAYDGAAALVSPGQAEAPSGRPAQEDSMADVSMPLKNPEALRLAWEFRQASGGPLSPVISGGNVYAGNATPMRRSGMIVCLNRETGGETWRTGIDGELQMYFAPDPRGDGLYCATGTWKDMWTNRKQKLGRVFGLEKSTGKMLWRIEKEGLPFSHPVLSDKNAYFGFGERGQWIYVYCLEKKSGKTIWSFTAESNIVETPPVLHEDRLYVSSGTANTKKVQIHCLDMKSGQLKWRYETEGYMDNYGCVPDGRNMLISIRGVDYRGVVLCLEAGTGRLIWKSEIGRANVSAPLVVSDGRLFIAARESLPVGAIICLDAENGETAWTFATDEKNVPESSPVISGNHVYAQAWSLEEGGYVYCLNKASGEALWRYRIKGGGSTTSAPVVSGECLYANGEKIRGGNGGIFCLDKNTGKLLRRLSSGSRTPSSPVIEGGILFAGTNDGFIYAYREGNLLAARVGIRLILGGLLLLFLFGILQEPIHRQINRKTGGPAYERELLHRRRLGYLERTFQAAHRLARSLSGGARVLIINIYLGWLLMFYILLMPLAIIYYLLVIIPWDPWLPRWWPLAVYGLMGGIVGMIAYLA